MTIQDRDRLIESIKGYSKEAFGLATQDPDNTGDLLYELQNIITIMCIAHKNAECDNEKLSLQAQKEIWDLVCEKSIELMKDDEVLLSTLSRYTLQAKQRVERTLQSVGEV